MEIVVIRHGQQEWIPGDVYKTNQGLETLGEVKSETTTAVVVEHSVDEICG